MKKFWRNERTRMLLTLELAIVLPAAALIAYSIWNLHTFQRDRAVEAAIVMEFDQVLKITEKQLNMEAAKLYRAVHKEFPCPEDTVSPAEKLDAFLAAHPQFAHAFFYEPKAGMVFRSQPTRMKELYFQKESKELAHRLAAAKAEAKPLVAKLRKLEKAGEPFLHYAHWVARGKGYGYTSFAYTALPAWPKDSVVFAGAVMDSEHLQRHVFPAVLNHVLAKDPQGGKNGSAVMMIHERKQWEPLAASIGWDTGKPEVQRNIEGAFPGLALSIKFRGTTIEALSRRFLRNSFATVGGLSLLLAAGILLTYRNVAREMALAKTKSDFVANVSHELRTPLALIRLYAETLELGRVTAQEKVREYYCIIRKESERLSALINNILDFSRIEAGRKEYDFRETNLSELVRQTLESYRYQIEQNGFRYEESIAEGLPPVRVDREAIARSLLNLVNNALKYSHQEKYLGVKLYRSNGAVMLEVVDRGIGIPTGEQAKVFEKFYRAGNPLVHNTKGSGLGLSLVRHIVQAHGGAVSVESAPGRGSRFVISLPLDGPAGASPAGQPAHAG